MNANYENYMEILVKKAKRLQTSLAEWRKDGEDDYFAAEVSYFIGYCLALEVFLDKKEET